MDHCEKSGAPKLLKQCSLPLTGAGVVDLLITNFHLPRSTLLMLVSAFTGHERMLDLYRHAIEQRYRFLSYGDAMLLQRQLAHAAL